MSNETLRSGGGTSPTLYFYQSNRTFGGMHPFVAPSSGHKVLVTASKNSDICTVHIRMERDGGVHFNVPNANQLGSQIIATLPAAYRPVADVYAIGSSSQNDYSGYSLYAWGSFVVTPTGAIYQKASENIGSMQIETSMEIIYGTAFYSLTGATSYTADGIV